MTPKILMSTALVALAAVVVSPGCLQSIEPDTARKFQAAQEAFDRARAPDDYRKVAAMYQEILDGGTESGVVLYNQGNAWMKAGERGRAIAAYRRAQRYMPQNPYLEANLQYAKGTDNTSGRRPVLRTILFWQDWLSYAAKFRLTAAAAGLAFVLAVAGLFAPWRKVLLRSALVGLALTALLLFSAGYDWYRFDHVERGVVVADEVIARKGNAESYEPAFTEPLSEGNEFRVLEHRGDWLHLALPGGQEGWILARAAETF